MKNRTHVSAGFTLLPVLLIILALLTVGGGAYTYYNAKQISAPAQQDQRYRAINKVFGVDAEYAYVYGGIGKGDPVVIKGADAKTFVAVGDYDAKDMNHTYALDPKGYLTIDGLSMHTVAPSDIAVEPKTISVPGMSQYVDVSFGFSFWYPSAWPIKITVPTDANIKAFPGGTVRKWITVGAPGAVTIAEVYSATATIEDTGGAGPIGPIKYWFDSNAHAWMTTNNESGLNPSFSGQAPADVSHNTMGGLHMLAGTSRFDSSIIPLSAQNFLFVNDGGGANAIFLAKTVVATDPAVATPVSAAEQQTAIEAEAKAYAGQ